jgi:mono/diheme cytochrome c family protein
MRNVFKVALAVSAFCISGSLVRADPQDKGKQVFDRWCSSCHGPGQRTPGTAALGAKYGSAEPAALEERMDLGSDTVQYFVRHGVSIMPPFRKTEISDAELGALADYLSHKPPGPKK